ncbi:MAG: tRNA (adenosine(37)-N6)-threonylcarbamoyltransferase complex transferase subunit TsaD [Caedibacter sp. 37-49]|nr:MAG: tRNA (adenosine(37)-N6)-threonylcarbamoyltransferase complex transferase subunit TsaD [Caedibacter sp. 37-49]
MLVLGIETSCDETSAAVVSSERKILSNVLISQIDEHKTYGGVVPEVGARAHLEVLETIISQALQQANVTLDDLEGIAVTAGPGLIGGVFVGVTMAKAIAAAKKIPFLAINHLAGHALTARLAEPLDFPYLLLLVSGGHSQLLIVKSALEYILLGTTLDDAVGEAFDKVAKILGLSYPGGPSIERLARLGDPKKFGLPRPLLHHKDASLKCSFSFSGLKTAVRQEIAKLPFMQEEDCQDMAASFQTTVIDILTDRSSNALEVCLHQGIALNAFVVAGGVASNQSLREALQKVCQNFGIKFIAPPAVLCTDNAAMIAWAGIEKLRLKAIDALDFAPKPRWPLESIKGGE